MTNRDFSKQDSTFIKACEQAGLKPTVRSASKFRNKRGKAWEAYRAIDKANK